MTIVYCSWSTDDDTGDVSTLTYGKFVVSPDVTREIA